MNLVRCDNGLQVRQGGKEDDREIGPENELAAASTYLADTIKEDREERRWRRPRRITLHYPDGMMIDLIESGDRSHWWSTDYEGDIANDTVTLGHEQVALMLTRAADCILDEVVPLEYNLYGAEELPR